MDRSSCASLEKDCRVVLDALRAARKDLLKASRQCDKWAFETEQGGWSTHQVKENLEFAHVLRAAADNASQVLEKIE